MKDTRSVDIDHPFNDSKVRFYKVYVRVQYLKCIMCTFDTSIVSDFIYVLEDSTCYSDFCVFWKLVVRNWCKLFIYKNNINKSIIVHFVITIIHVYIFYYMFCVL